MLTRRMHKVLGKSPLSYFQDLRVESAVHLLKTSDETVDQIASRVGYSDAVILRVLLRHRLGLGVRELRPPQRRVAAVDSVKPLKRSPFSGLKTDAGGKQATTNRPFTGAEFIATSATWAKSGLTASASMTSPSNRARSCQLSEGVPLFHIRVYRATGRLCGGAAVSLVHDLRCFGQPTRHNPAVGIMTLMPISA
jgi:hypothetical protein